MVSSLGGGLLREREHGATKNVGPERVSHSPSSRCDWEYKETTSKARIWGQRREKNNRAMLEGLSWTRTNSTAECKGSGGGKQTSANGDKGGKITNEKRRSRSQHLQGEKKEWGGGVFRKRWCREAVL